MKYLSLLPLAGLAVAAPGSAWNDDPVKVSTTTSAASTWSDADIPVTVTETDTATGTYCPKTGKITKPAPDNDVAKCTISVTKVTTTVTSATATVTVTEKGHGGPPAGDKTVTVTVTESGKPGAPGKTETVTKTADCAGPTGGPGHGGPGGPPAGGKCLSDDGAKKIVDNFRDLLEYTSFVPSKERPGAPGRGYHYNVSAATLDPKFVDISDSINLMAGFPLGSVTFPNKTAFDYGQGVLQPEVITETLNIFHDCNSITWRWKITPKVQAPLVAYPVVGINHMIVGDNGLLVKNYAEFDNAAWLSSFGAQCSQAPIKVVDGKFATK